MCSHRTCAANHTHPPTHTACCRPCLPAQRVQERADKVKEAARPEVGSWVRYYLFAFLAFVLAAEVAADLQSGGWARCAMGDSDIGHGRLGAPPATCAARMHGRPRRCLVPCCSLHPPTHTHTCCCPCCADAPSAAQDVLYTLLVIALGWTSYSERKSLR